MKKHSYFVDTKLQFDQIKKKKLAKFTTQLFIRTSNIFKSQNNHNLWVKRVDTINYRWLVSQLSLPTASFDLNFSVL